MTSEETKKLQHIVERYAQLAAKIAAAREEQKELAATAWETCEVPAKVLRQLAKETGWTGFNAWHNASSRSASTNAAPPSACCATRPSARGRCKGLPVMAATAAPRPALRP